MLYPSIVNFTNHELAQGIKIVSPASGKIEQLYNPNNSEQESIVTALMGQGVAIRLDSKEILSPIKGTIIEWIPSLGKIVIQASNKLRFLIQLPLSYSVNNGIGITPHIKLGQVVEAAQPLMTLDLYKIQLVEKPIMLMFMLLDHNQIQSIDVFNKRVTAGVDVVFSLVAKPRSKSTPSSETTRTTNKTKQQAASSKTVNVQPKQSKPIQKTQGN